MRLLNKRFIAALMGMLPLAAASQAVSAAPVMWLTDSRGNIGYVDLADGTTTTVGFAGMLSDIAYDSSGNLWGLGFATNPTLLYRVDPSTGDTTLVGSTLVDRMNGLTFGPDGTLWGATSSNAATPSLYKINTSNGAAMLVGSMGFACAGDLTFSGGILYMAAASFTPGGNDLLVRLNTTTGAGTLIGSLRLRHVYGLDTAEEDGVTYAVSGTSIYRVHLSNGATTFVLDYEDHGLAAAYGTAFAEIPEPGTIVILLAGGVLLSLHRRR